MRKYKYFVPLNPAKLSDLIKYSYLKATHSIRNSKYYLYTGNFYSIINWNIQ